MTRTTGLLSALLAAPGLVVAASALAQPFDGSQALLCATSEILVCEPVAGCERVTAESINAPRFIRIDPTNKMLTAMRPEFNNRSSKIENVENLDGKYILQGIEDGQESVQDGLGWSLAISEAHGTMVLSAAAEDVAYTVFGACTAAEGSAGQ